MRFEGRVVTEWLHTQDHPDRDMLVLEPFKFIDSTDKEWLVPKNAIINGASIPRFLWRLVGSPYIGRYRRASVVHDWFCEKRKDGIPSYKVHRMFYEACLTDGIPEWKCKILFYSVYFFGPKF